MLLLGFADSVTQVFGAARADLGIRTTRIVRQSDTANPMSGLSFVIEPLRSLKEVERYEPDRPAHPHSRRAAQKPVLAFLSVPPRTLFAEAVLT
jgi:hypothetical protein